MLRKIFKCIPAEGNASNIDQTLAMEKSEAFIARECACETYGKNQFIFFSQKFMGLEFLVKQSVGRTTKKESISVTKITWSISRDNLFIFKKYLNYFLKISEQIVTLNLACHAKYAEQIWN